MYNFQSGSPIHRIHKWQVSWGERAVKQIKVKDDRRSDWVNMSLFASKIFLANV